MGTWGFSPEENDSAWDLFYAALEQKDSAKFVVEEFKRTLRAHNSHHIWESIGGVILGLGEGWSIPKEVLEQAARALLNVAGDEEFLYSWGRPKEVRRECFETAKKLMTVRCNPRKSKKLFGAKLSHGIQG